MVRQKTKKKQWFPILSPRLFESREIGETHLWEPEKGLGRKININLKLITGNLVHQNSYLVLKITDFAEGKFKTEFVKYYLLPSYLRKLPRKGGSIIEESFLTKSQEGKPIRIKILLITPQRISRSLRTKLRKKAREFVEEFFLKNPLEEIIKQTISHQLVNQLGKALHRLYPIKTKEIKSLELIG